MSTRGSWLMPWLEVMVTLRTKQSVAISPHCSRCGRQADLQQQLPRELVRSVDSRWPHLGPCMWGAAQWALSMGGWGTILERHCGAALASRQVCAVGVEGSAAGSFFHVLYFSSCFDAFLLLYEKKRKLHTNMWVHALSCSLLDSSFTLTTKPIFDVIKAAIPSLICKRQPSGGDTDKIQHVWSHFSGWVLLPHSWHLSWQPANLRPMGHCVSCWQTLTITLRQ